MAETLVVYLMLMVLFAGSWQLAELASAQLVVRRAASAAARAAAVVLSDDLESCELMPEEKNLRIHVAASLVLRAAPHTELSEVRHQLQGTGRGEQNVRADVRVQYQCRLLPLLCLPWGHRELEAHNTQAHQTARYGDCAPGGSRSSL
jgi:Flp pilus assembly protein TadG